MVVLEQLKSASICRIFFSFKLIASSFSSFLFFFLRIIFRWNNLILIIIYENKFNYYRESFFFIC